MPLQATLTDIIQLGPIGQRTVSARCSVCGDYLIAGFAKSQRPSVELLNAAIQDVFARHLKSRHRGRGFEKTEVSTPPLTD